MPAATTPTATGADWSWAPLAAGDAARRLRSLLLMRRLWADPGPCDAACGTCYRCRRAIAWMADWWAQPDTTIWIEPDGPGLCILSDQVVDGACGARLEAQLHLARPGGGLGRLTRPTLALLDALGFARVYCAVPAYAHKLGRYVTRVPPRGLGFRPAGYPGDRVQWQGRWWPVAVYHRWGGSPCPVSSKASASSPAAP